MSTEPRDQTPRQRRSRKRPDDYALWHAIDALEERVRHCDARAHSYADTDYLHGVMTAEADHLRAVCAWLRHQRDLALRVR